MNDLLSPLREMFIPSRSPSNNTAATPTTTTAVTITLPNGRMGNTNNNNNKTATNRNSSASRSAGDRLVVLFTAGASIALAVKLYQNCVRRVDAEKEFGVVYDVRRGSVFSSSALPEHATTSESSSPSTRPSSNKKQNGKKAAETLAKPPKSLVQKILRNLFPPIGKNILLIPPSGLHKYFAFPLSVLNPSQGISNRIVIQNVEFADSQFMKSIEFQISCYIDVRDVPRYLCVVGAQLPTRLIGDVAGACLREDAAQANIGNIKQYFAVYHKQNKKSSFFQSLIEKMSSRLVAEACVVVKDVVVVKAEFEDL